jgi:arylsulfatase A-like enzyme
VELKDRPRASRLAAAIVLGAALALALVAAVDPRGPVGSHPRAVVPRPQPADAPSPVARRDAGASPVRVGSVDVGPPLDGDRDAGLGGGPPPDGAPDVILVVIDTLRADAVGCYGSPLGLTPTIDGLAKRGTRFDRALATSSWTVPSMASLLTGLWPEEHGVVRGTAVDGEVVGQRGLPAGLTTLAEAFRARGYRTAGIVANAHLSEPLGFAQGFDLFYNAGFASASSVLKWLRDHRGELRGGRPLFLWVHLFDPHHPYRPRRPWFEDALRSDGPALDEAQRLAAELYPLSMPALLARRDLARGSPRLRALRAAYLSEVGYADRAVAEALELAGADDGTLVVVTSDHGEEFADHGRLGHRTSLYSELVRVPLVVSWPARLPPRAPVEAPVSLVDVYPSLLELAGLGAPASGLPGRSLVGRGGLSVRGGPRPLHSSVWFDGRTISSAAIGRLRVIVDPRAPGPELYDEVADPVDAADLARSRPGDASRLGREIERHLAAARLRAALPEPVTVPAELVEQLRRLGYVE